MFCPECVGSGAETLNDPITYTRSHTRVDDMRPRYALAAGLLLTATGIGCSDSSGPHQIPVLTTQLSASVESVTGTLQVTLHASNPTDTTLHLSWSGVVAEIKLQGQWNIGSGLNDGFVGSPGVDTLSLISGAGAPLGTVNVTFSPPAFVLSQEEAFTLSPGTYSVRACYYPWQAVSGPGGVAQAACGNTVQLTLTP